MRIAITGSSGLIGTAVSPRLERDGHDVTRLVRSRDAARADDAIYWSPDRQEIDRPGLARHDAFINLAGENIFGIWTAGKKRRIRSSRVQGTDLLTRTLATLPQADRPKVLINASAVGYYGDRPNDEALSEDADSGRGFMADVVRDWERAVRPAADAGVRTLCLRFGVVVDPHAILLKAAGTATRFGLGAKIGRGDQPFPWVTRAEIAEVAAFVLDREDLDGAFNVVAREQVTNEQFVDTLARVLHRPRVLAIPKPALKLLGGLGDEVATGALVVPTRLQEAGYTWRDPDLEPALRRMLHGR